jgi:hypothetical protein
MLFFTTLCLVHFLKFSLTASTLERLIEAPSIYHGSTSPSCAKAIIIPGMVWVNALRRQEIYFVTPLTPAFISSKLALLHHDEIVC